MTEQDLRYEAIRNQFEELQDMVISRLGEIDSLSGRATGLSLRLDAHKLRLDNLAQSIKGLSDLFERVSALEEAQE